MTAIGTFEHFEQLRQKWYGDGTYAYPLKRSPESTGFHVYAFGRWWLTSKKPTANHAHRLPFWT
jgi:hypothetical protein